MTLTMYTLEDAKRVAAYVRTLDAYRLNVSRKHTTVEMHSGSPLPETLKAQRALRLFLEANLIRTTSRVYGF